jgi:hypothetical protein
MIPKYLATLVATVIIATLVASSLKFATSSQVLSGKALSENLKYEFTIAADKPNTYYVINADMAQFLQTHTEFTTQGPPHVVSANIQVTPKQVSWSEDRNTITAPGAAMNVQLEWNTPPDAANGAPGSIYLSFPQIPGLEGKTVTLRSGPFQVDSAGRTAIRQVTTYRSAAMVAIGRFVFALAAGLPFGILLHSLCWAFAVWRERRTRLAALQPQSAGLPRTFYPNPIAEWVGWLFALGMGGFMGSMVAGFSVADGFMSSSLVHVVYIELAIATAIALLVIYIIGKRVLTVRVEADGISYARGRENMQWTSAVWSQMNGITQKSKTYRGNRTYWIEIKFSDGRKKLKIGQSITDYAGLRDLLLSTSAGRIRS